MKVTDLIQRLYCILLFLGVSGYTIASPQSDVTPVSTVAEPSVLALVVIGIAMLLVSRYLKK